MYRLFVITNLLNGRKLMGVSKIKTIKLTKIDNSVFIKDLHRFGSKNFRIDILHSYKNRNTLKGILNTMKNKCYYNIKVLENKYLGTKVVMIKDGYRVKVFDSVTGAAKYVNGSKGNISSVCSGRHKSAYGFTWKYV